MKLKTADEKLIKSMARIRAAIAEFDAFNWQSIKPECRLAKSLIAEFFTGAMFSDDKNGMQQYTVNPV